jgi:hypothetical protein
MSPNFQLRAGNEIGATTENCLLETGARFEPLPHGLPWVSKVRNPLLVWTPMNVQLHRVISNISGTTGTAIIRAMVVGERDCTKLAARQDGRIQASSATIAAALTGLLPRIGVYSGPSTPTVRQASNSDRGL